MLRNSYTPLLFTPPRYSLRANVYAHFSIQSAFYSRLVWHFYQVLRPMLHRQLSPLRVVVEGEPNYSKIDHA
jgi:hypothetical protein